MVDALWLELKPTTLQSKPKHLGINPRPGMQSTRGKTVSTSIRGPLAGR
jgi:hypothetical protein